MLIIQGSHRKTGNTAAAVKALAERLDAQTIHLADLKLAQFSYAGTTDDDFVQVIQKMIKHRKVVWATPVYWYTMSGMMKVLLDRISDLLKWNKDLGRQLRGLEMHIISVSEHDDVPQEFSNPFRMSAEYLGWTFGTYCHLYGKSGLLSAESMKRLDAFADQI
ncbi:flavodoxin family protein [Portibacter marinus]|uniref:flavodoxin family protein n=1 Tax=Portibacter marinus TaxID=2898660 RepID=UPI001F230C05|nr:NAD(P)H-dependent oxidoreductase [Portibacter marinus]